jgi:hypothetical protein
MKNQVMQAFKSPKLFFTGTFCEYAMNPCESEPCANAATCTHDDVNFTCSCAPGFLGPLCEVIIYNKINIISREDQAIFLIHILSLYFDIGRRGRVSFKSLCKSWSLH